MKKIVIALLVVFVLWAMIQRPAQAADFTQTAGAWTWDMTQQVFGGLIDMGDRLFTGSGSERAGSLGTTSG